MRQPIVATILILTAVTLCAGIGLAQQPQLPALKPPPPAPIKPYPAVAVTPPAALDDPGFVAFRKQLRDAAEHKDRAALAKLVVAQGFFWMQDKDLADKHKPGIANLTSAVALDAPDGGGWRVLAAFADDPSAAEVPQQKGVFCAPADPAVDPKEIETLAKETGTDPFEWAYPTKAGAEVHAAAQPSSPVIDKLGMTLVRVLSDTIQPENPSEPFFVHIAMPSGKTGFVNSQSLSPLAGEQICYVKGAGGWKITGIIGGATQ
ncbi:MAG: hypothetical protein P4L80_06715 [Xanthobacteraceae bacterium]|nr:hypothetical protein [Xanthobacteraceae bacterium]